MILLNTLKKYKKIPLHLLFWVLVWWFYIYFFGFNSTNEKYIYWFSSILVPITIANTYLSIYFLIPKYLIKNRYWKFALYSFYSIVISAYIVSIFMFFGFVYLSELDFKEMPPLSRSLPFILISVYLVVLIVSAFKLIKYNFRSRENQKTLENKILESQLRLKKEELKYLKMQIHPHFLFNTLNTLYGFALKKADETPDMILKLSNLLDYILYQIDKPFVLLSEELNHILDYIALEKMRFIDTLDVNINFEETTDSYKIAPMLLIPLVENSFKHGEIVDGLLKINIETVLIENELIFKIKNSIKSTIYKENGIGIENLKKRLNLLYKNQYSLKINQKENEFEVILELKIVNERITG